MKEAMANLYSLLRLSENTEGATSVIISNFDSQDNFNKLPDFLETIKDKILRAS